MTDHRPPGRTGSAQQLYFDLRRNPSFDHEEFLVSSCNEAAYSAIRNWPTWPDQAFLLLGPEGSGKSHLAAIWATLAGATMISIGAPLPTDMGQYDRAAVLEDCDRVPFDEVALFHHLNAVREAGGWLLMTARKPPDFWKIGTPDLLSRLRLAPSAEIGHPDLVLLKAVILKLFADRQIAVDEHVVAYAARHCEQSLAAVSEFVAAVDDASLGSGRRITRSLAAAILPRLSEGHYDSSLDSPQVDNVRN